jgi:S1-C subfamily serine protease
MKAGLAAVTFLWCCCCIQAWGQQEALDQKDAVVKIYTIYQRYNYNIPWQMKGQESKSGSGCIICNSRILTNAHVVGDQVFIQVRRAGQTKRYTAQVETVAHDCDLAVLTVADASFFSGVRPIAIGQLPRIQDKVCVYGFPEGGDKLSITEGVVSRIEHVKYAHSNAFLLAGQIDAAINAGSSGGAVIKDNQLMGVAFQAAGTLQNVGYMVPTTIIQRFLKDIEDGQYEGIPCLGVYCQKLENADIRSCFGLSGDEIGVLVTKVYENSPASGIIQPGDIILAVDDKKVGNDGTIEFRKGQRTFFEQAVQGKQINDTVSLEIIRDKQPMHVSMTLSAPIDFWRLVPPAYYDVPPTYYIAGGLVFEPLTVNYLKEWGANWVVTAPLDLVRYYGRGEKTAHREQVIVLAKVLSDELNTGYQDEENEVIQSVNGRTISSIRDLVAAFEQNDGRYHVIRDENGYTIVLDRQKVNTLGPGILGKYRVGSDRSLDLEF